MEVDCLLLCEGGILIQVMTTYSGVDLAELAGCWDYMTYEKLKDFVTFDHHRLFVIYKNRKIVGGALFHAVKFVSADLLHIFIAPEMRGQGVANQALGQCFQFLEKDLKIKEVFLEVSVANAPARKLYQNLGGLDVGYRAGYYSNGEDAVVVKIVV